MSSARSGSRLEIDDGEHCKVCGAELPGDTTDSEGCRIIWQSDSMEWERIEKCPSCWARHRLNLLVTDCMERYDGALPRELDGYYPRQRYSDGVYSDE